MAKSFEALRDKMSLKAQLQAKQEAAKLLEEIRRSQLNSNSINPSLNNS